MFTLFRLFCNNGAVPTAGRHSRRPDGRWAAWCVRLR